LRWRLCREQGGNSDLALCGGVGEVLSGEREDECQDLEDESGGSRLGGGGCKQVKYTGEKMS
jgi:hypothetical protein